MPRDKSVIPPGAQTPAMIALAVLFVVILIWRFAPGNGEGDDATVALPDAADQEVSLADLKKVIEEINKGEIKTASRSDEIPTLEKDPFSIPEDALTAMREGEVGRLTRDFKDAEKEAEEEAQLEKVETGPTRKEILDSLRLTTICMIGEVRMAVVNGSFLKEGDTLSDFVVKTIKEREVILMDDEGSETIKMEEIPLL